jgi:hypothetical protein
MPGLPGGNTAGSFDVETTGFPLLIAKVAGVAVVGDRWGKETAERAGRIGSDLMARAAPEGENFDLPPAVEGVKRRTPPRTRPRLKSRISYQRTARWNPGGLGGGGYWSVRFGVGDVGIRPLGHDPASILFHGSGIRGDAFAKGGKITASVPGNVMTFMHGGRQVFARSVGGQRPQTRWVKAGQDAARAEIRRRVVELRAELAAV